LLTLNNHQASDQLKRELYHSNSLYLNETIPVPASHDRIFRIKDLVIEKNGVSDTIYLKSLSDRQTSDPFRQSDSASFSAMNQRFSFG